VTAPEKPGLELWRLLTAAAEDIAESRYRPGPAPGLECRERPGASGGIVEASRPVQQPVGFDHLL